MTKTMIKKSLRAYISGDEEEPDDSEGSVTVKIEQYFNAKGFSEEKPKVEQTDEQAQWDRDNQTLTWNDVTIEAGEEWSQTITVLIDTANLTSIDALPTNLISQAKVFDAESEDPENEPLATKEAEEIDLKTFVGEKSAQWRAWRRSSSRTSTGRTTTTQRTGRAKLTSSLKSVCSTEFIKVNPVKENPVRKVG